MNDEIVVYGFIRRNGEEDGFITLDRHVALMRSVRDNSRVIERTYEYKSSRFIKIKATIEDTD
jgi:hypothetical protein